jgi:hypothetical protein
MFKEILYKITKPNPAEFTSFNQIPVQRKGDFRKDEYHSITKFVIGCYADHPTLSIHVPLDYLCDWFTLDWKDKININSSRASPPTKQDVINERRDEVFKIYINWVKKYQGAGYIFQEVPDLEFDYEYCYSGYP